MPLAPALLHPANHLVSKRLCPHSTFRNTLLFMAHSMDSLPPSIDATTVADSPLRAHADPQFCAIADSAPAILWITEANGYCSFLSAGWYELTGQGLDESLGLGWTAAVHPDDRLATRVAFLKAQASQCRYDIEHRLRQADGSWIWVIDTGQPRHSPSGQYLGHVGSVTNVHARRIAEDALRRSEDRYSKLLASIEQGFCVIQMIFGLDGRAVDYRFLEVNQVFERQTGLTDTVGRTALDMAATLDSHWLEFYGEVALTQRSNRFTQGAELLGRWFDVHATPIGEPSAYQVALFFSDISERKRAEMALIQADHRKDEFLATLAHELRNPLAPIRSTLEAMRLKGCAAPELERDRHMIERQINHLTRLVDDLLDVGRITTNKLELQMQSLSVAGLIKNVVEAILVEIEAGRHTLNLELPDAAVHLQGDPVRLTQMVLNLLNNAIKYSPQGSRIGLSAQFVAGELLIRVTDQGQGISAENLPRVFDMFFQAERGLERARGGLGIGLSLVKRLTEMHGGSVGAASDGENLGSTFTVRLPGCSNIEPAISNPALPEQRSGTQTSRQHILVVDDNRDAADTFAEVLQMMGYRTDTAYDGLEGFEKAGLLLPDVVVFDIGMPRLNGYEACQRLRSEPWGKQMLVLAVSGWGQKEDLKRSCAAGFDAHFVKPVMPGDLTQKIEELRAAQAKQL